MRVLLEFLGIIEPRRRRREPVALPAWSRSLPLLVVVAFAVASTILAAIIRAVVG